MFKDFFGLTKIFLTTYKWYFLYFITLPVFGLLFITSLIQPNDVIEKTRGGSSEILIVFAACSIAIGLFLVYSILGSIFNVSQRGSWFAQLPFSNFSKNTLPLSIITLIGLILLNYFPLGYFRTGSSLFFIGIPIMIFLIFKFTKNELIGCLKLTLTLLPIVILALSIGWFYVRPQLIGELWIIFFYFGVWLILAQRDRLYLILPLSIVLLYFGGVFFKAQSSLPKGFSEALYNYSLYPTEKTLSIAKKMALNKNIWGKPDSYGFRKYLDFISKEIAKQMTDEELIQYVQNIQLNHKLWDGIKFPKYRKNSFGIYFYPSDAYWLTDSRFPIDHEVITPSAEEYIYSHWENSQFLCRILPPKPSKIYLKKLFLEPECQTSFNIRDVRHMYVTGTDAYKNLFHSFLLNAYENSPPLTRSELMMTLISYLRLDVEKYFKKRNIYFSQKDITEEDLSTFLSESYLPEKIALKKLQPLSRQQFIKAINDFPSGGRHERFPLHYFCKTIFPECYQSSLKLFREKNSYIIFLYESLKGALKNGRMTYIRKKVLKDEKNWNQIKSSLDNLYSTSR